METIKKELQNQTAGKSGNHEYVINGVIDLNQLVGKWKLTYNISNTLKAVGFGSVTLEPYMHPISRKWQYPMVDNQPKVIVEITAAETIYNPDEKLNDKSMVNWMLNHPRVMVDGVTLDPKIMASKEANSKFRLYNVDMRDVSEYEEENEIDAMVGRLTLNTGDKAVGLEKLRWILAKLNMPFKDRRIMVNPKAEKLILRNKLKSHVKKSTKNAKEVKMILNNLEDAKKHFCIKILVESGDITIANGMLKYKAAVLGLNVDSAVSHLEQDANVWLEIQDLVGKIMKKELN